MKFFKILFIAVSLFSVPLFIFSQEEKQVEETKEVKEKQEKEEVEESEEEKVKKAITESLPLLEIKRLETEAPLYSIELRNVELADFFRVVAHDYDLNILIDKSVTGKVTASLTNISLEEALEEITNSNNLILKKRGNIIKVTPNFITKIFVLNHVEVKSLLQPASTEGESQESEAQAQEEVSQEGVVSEGAASESQSGGSVEGSAAAPNTIYDLLSEGGKVLFGSQPNSLMVIDYPENVEKIEMFLNMVDKRMQARVFKLKYISASVLVGEQKEEGEGETETEEGTASQPQPATGE